VQQRRRLLGFRRWQSVLRRSDRNELHALLHEAIGLLGNDLAVAARFEPRLLACCAAAPGHRLALHLFGAARERGVTCAVRPSRQRAVRNRGAQKTQTSLKRTRRT
jgi:hypothetical protein